MKKLFIIAAIAVSGFNNINAQDVKFGVKAGVNIASIGGDAIDLNSRTDFHAGFVTEISIAEKFSIQPELLYSAKGAIQNLEDIDVDLILNYLNLPLMAKFYVAEGFSIEAGPLVGLLLSAKAKSGPNEEDLKDAINAIDFGANFGLGFKMKNGLNFAAQYDLGLANINEGDVSDETKNQNNVIQISVGYFFN